MSKMLLSPHSSLDWDLFPDAGEAGGDDFSILGGERDFEATGGGDETGQGGALSSGAADPNCLTRLTRALAIT